MTKRYLVSCILVGLAAALAQVDAVAQSAIAEQSGVDSDTGKPRATQLEAVTVTGSLIPQAQIENSSPVLTITAEQIKRQGFGNIYDALRALPLATGSVQDGQTQGGFTQGAGTISLLSLDPAFTLTLIDGHPLADYPLLYNGQSNFADLQNIPIGMVDHIDILPGNQSAIYGSSAIAGVINIILKQRVTGVELNYRVGGFDRGGGANQRVELLGGFNRGTIDLTWGLQIGKQDPIWGFQRPEYWSTKADADPNARYATRTILYDYIKGGTHYVDPGAANCAGLSNLFGNTTAYSFRPGRGYYCGSTEQPGYGTLAGGTRTVALYLHGSDRISDSLELYGTLLFNVDSERYNDGSRVYLSNGGNLGDGNFFNATTGRTESFQRYFAPEETGGLDATDTRELKRAYNFYGGARGSIGGSAWNYDAYFDRSYYLDKNDEPWPLQDKIDSFFEQQFLGPKLGFAGGAPIYAPNPANFYQTLTPAQYASFQGLIASKSKTWTQHVNLQVTNTELFNLPAGAVGVAGIAQVGNQYWTNPVQPELLDGSFYGRSGTSGEGKRKNYAIGGEMRAPLTSMLIADGSVRYDEYSNVGGGSDSKATYKLGLEFRPIDSLLFRGSYATAFRAPDMGYTFAGASGSFTTVNDYYRCATEEPGVSIQDCDYSGVGIFSQHGGNRDLKSITAKSFGAGVVWSPTAELSIKTDYYNIKINNEVQREDRDLFLRQELACRTGQLDIASPACVTALSRIIRAPANAPIPGELLEVDNYPINIANEHISGLLFNLDYRLDAGRFGQLHFGANYNVTLKHTQQSAPGDPVIDDLRDPFNSTSFKTIFTGSVAWQRNDWSASVSGTRYGKTPNLLATQSGGYSAPGAGTVTPWMLYNGSLGYSFSDKASFTFIVNNIFNSGPPVDVTNVVPPPPFYNTGNYNPLGRQYWLEFDVHFGAGK